MKQLIGRSCKITINVDGRSLFYTAKEVLDISSTHILFKDKFDKQYSFRLQDVLEIQDVK